eukprot:326277-Amphidinium_carterae.1
MVSSDPCIARGQRRDLQGAEDLDITAMLASVRAHPPQRQKVLVKMFAGGLIVDERMQRWQQRQRDLQAEDTVDGICSHCPAWWCK